MVQIFISKLLRMSIYESQIFVTSLYFQILLHFANLCQKIEINQKYLTFWMSHKESPVPVIHCNVGLLKKCIKVLNGNTEQPQLIPLQ